MYKKELNDGWFSGPVHTSLIGKRKKKWFHNQQQDFYGTIVSFCPCDENENDEIFLQKCPSIVIVIISNCDSNCNSNCNSNSDIKID